MRKSFWDRFKSPPSLETEYQPPFSAEAAIKSTAQDLLNRGNFVAAISKVLLDWRSEKSLVVAIRGAWGFGKTSIKNLIIERLRADEKSTAGILEFNPWQYSTDAAISEAFYREVAIALGDVDQSFEGWSRKRAFRVYGKFFSGLADGAKAAEKAPIVPAVVGWVASVGVILAGLNTVFPAKLMAVSAQILIVVAAVSWTLGKILTLLAGEALKDKPIHIVRQGLEKKLLKLKRPLIVVIDDIDRLDSNGIQLIFRHVKVNADLPGISYLLLFQQDIVENALNGISGNEGRRYLEKIVQASFDLPVVEQARVNQALFSALDKIIDPLVDSNSHFDQDRWANVFHGGLQVFFKNLRDVHRYVASVTVQTDLHRGRVFEVNIIDLLVLEALRIFEPEVYGRIAREKQLLTNGVSRGDSKFKPMITSIPEASSEPNRDQVEKLFRGLFPFIDWAFPAGLHYSEPAPDWWHHRRVCSPAFFDRYFALRIPDQSVSESDYLAFIERSDDRAFIDQYFEELKHKDAVGIFLERLDAGRDRLPRETANTLALALFDLGETFQDTAFGPFTSCWRVASSCIRSEPELEKRGSLFLEALHQANGLAVPSVLIGLEEKRRTDPGSRTKLLLNDEQLPAAKTVWLERLKAQLADRRQVLVNPHLLSFLIRWREYEGEAGPRAWVQETAAMADLLPALLRVFVLKSTVTTMGDYVSKDLFRLSLRYLQMFIHPDVVEERISELLDRSNFSAADRAVLDQFEAARRAPSDDPWQGDGTEQDEATPDASLGGRV